MHKGLVNTGSVPRYQITYEIFHQKWKQYRLMELTTKNDSNSFKIIAKNSCRKPIVTNKQISALKPISGSNLILEEVSLGAYLRLKLVHQCFSVVAIAGLGEDSDGNLFQFSVYDFPLKGKHYDHYFQPGKTILIKEPYFKTGRSGNVFIRIDDPEDLVFEDAIKVESTADKIFQDIRKEGKQYVLASNYLEAFVTYSQGLKEIVKSQHLAILWTNKAICCLKLNLIEDHRQCAKEALKADPNNPRKPLYHQIRNFIWRNNYEAARKLLKENNQLFDQQECEALRIQIMEKELASKGKLNWKNILIKNNLPQFFSELLKLEKGKNGMGVFAKERISSGTFLMSERPIIWQKVQEEEQQESRFELGTKVLKRKEEMEFETKMIKLAKNSQQFHNKIKRLYREGLAEVSRAERSNGRDLSAKDIIEAKDMNVFSTDRLPDLGEDGGTQFRLGKALLLYDICSMLNHSCQANCKYFHVGTSMVVLAFQDILPGQELFIQYTDKSNILLSKWGINCSCAFCTHSVNSKTRSTKVLRDKIMRGGSVSPQELGEIERVIFFEDGIQSLHKGRNNTCALFLSRVFGLNGRQAEEVMDKLEIKPK